MDEAQIESEEEILKSLSELNYTYEELSYSEKKKKQIKSVQSFFDKTILNYLAPKSTIRLTEHL